MEIHTTDMEDIIESYATMDELEGQLAAGKEDGLQVYLEELSRTMDRLEFRFKTMKNDPGTGKACHGKG